MRATDLFDSYLNGKLSEEGKKAFEQQLTHDAVLARAFAEHRELVQNLKTLEERRSLHKQLKDIHEKEFGKPNVISINRNGTFARRHGRTMVIAASTALFAVISTVAMLSTGGYLLQRQSTEITNLNRRVTELQASSNAIVQGITKGSKKVVYAPANLAGTGFAINNQGYLITSYHIVNGADSIFVQNSSIERAHARLVMADPKLDLAVLRLEDGMKYKGWQVPFVINTKSTDLGEKVFTLGYPRNEVVYGEGALSSMSGYSNDTSMYQISIPVNPGNSGGPLLDENGNVIGVIRGKIQGAEATGFAIKSLDILHSMELAGADTLKKNFEKNVKRPPLKSLKRAEQIRRINPYVFNVLVYKND